MKKKHHKGKIAAAVAVGTLAAISGGAHLHHLHGVYKQQQANRAFENHSADMYNLIYPPTPRSAMRTPTHYHGGIADVKIPQSTSSIDI